MLKFHQKRECLKGYMPTRVCTISVLLMFMLFQVSGDANEQQFLVSLRTYVDRPELVTYALRKLYTYLEDGHLKNLHNEIVLVRCLSVFCVPRFLHLSM